MNLKIKDIRSFLWFFIGGLMVFCLIGLCFAPIFRKQDDINIEQITNKSDILDPLIGDNSSDVKAFIWIPSTGYGNMPHWEVNKTYVKQFLKDNMKWRLQASNNMVDWYDANSLLDIDLDWVDTNSSYKVTLTLNTTLAPKELFYRFDLACNKSLKQYAEIDGYEWTLTMAANSTENYTLFFNWSDIKDLVSSGKVTLDKGVKDNFFWFRIQSVNKIPVGTVFVIDPSYGVIADSAVDSFEWDAQEGWVLTPENILIKLNNSEYYMTCAGSGDGTADYDGYLNTFQVSNNGSFTTKTIISQWEYDISDGLYAGVIPLENVNDTYIVYYRDAAAGVIFTTRAFANDGTLQKTQIATRSYTYPHTSQMLHVTGDVYALIYQEGGGGYDYFLETYNIWNNGTISSRIDYVEWDQTSAAAARDWHPQAVMVDTDTIAIVWCESVGSDGWITTYNISSAGDITNTASDVWEFNNEYAKFPYLINISGDVYAIAYQDASGDGRINTTTISDTGILTKTFIDSLEFDAADCVFPTVFVVNDASDFTTGVYGITYQGTGADGFACTMNISSDGTVGDSIIDFLEFDAADSRYYCNAVHVSGNYYLFIYTGTDNDGWSKIVYITTGGAGYYVEYLTANSGNWTVPANVNKITVLVVGGGGGGGKCGVTGVLDAGGGGAGGLVFMENITTIGEISIIEGNNISYSIGGGGAGSTIATSKGGSGTNTTFGNLTSVGGAGGGSYQNSDGADGGCGGGGAQDAGGYGSGGSATQSAQVGWSGMYGYGYNGANAAASTGGGGGGAGGAASGETGGVGKDYSDFFGKVYGVSGVFSEGGSFYPAIGYTDGPANSGYGGDAGPSGTGATGKAGGSGIICIRYSLETLGNNAPVLSNEDPANNSINVPIDVGSFNITIEDPDGDTFNYSWACSDGSYNSASGNTNGTKTLMLNMGDLDYNTVYTWWVYAIDINGNWDNETYTFTTTSGAETRNIIEIFDYYFNNGGNITTRANAIVFDYYFNNGGNVTTRSNATIFDYYFNNGGNITTRSNITIFDYYFNNGGNVTIRFNTTIFDYYFNSGGNIETRLNTTVFDYYFNNGGNYTPRINNTIFDYYFNSGGNITTRSNTTIFDYYFNNGGNTTTRSNTTIFDYYFNNGGNITTRLNTTIFDYYFNNGGNVTTRSNATIFDYYFNNGGNITTRSNITIFDYYFNNAGNITTRINTTIFDYYFNNGGNITYGLTIGIPNPANNSIITDNSLTWNIQINSSNLFNWSLNCSNGQNNSADNENNGTKNLSLSSLNIQTYIVWLNITDVNSSYYYWFDFTVTETNMTGSFTVDIQEQKVKITPTLGNDVDYYRFKIKGEDGFEGFTDWIPAGDINDQMYNLEWNKRYTITMWFKSGTSMNWYTSTFTMPNPPPMTIPDEEEPIKLNETEPSRKNIFDWIPEPIKNWWNPQHVIVKLLIVAPFIIIPLILIGRNKHVKKYYHVKKKGVEEHEKRK